MLDIAADVAGLPGGEDAVLTVFHAAEPGCRCTVCGDLAPVDRHTAP